MVFLAGTDCPPVVGDEAVIAGANAAGLLVPVAVVAAFAPPVSAGVPPASPVDPSISDVMEVAAVPGLNAGAATASFDRAMSASAQSNAGVGAAGKVVNRFAPPVASPPPRVDINVASALDVGVLIQPCDTPGSGCRVISAPPGVPPSQGNPPIIPGRLPPVPIGAP